MLRRRTSQSWRENRNRANSALAIVAYCMLRRTIVFCHRSIYLLSKYLIKLYEMQFYAEEALALRQDRRSFAIVSTN